MPLAQSQRPERGVPSHLHPSTHQFVSEHPARGCHLSFVRKGPGKEKRVVTSERLDLTTCPGTLLIVCAFLSKEHDPQNCPPPVQGAGPSDSTSGLGECVLPRPLQLGDWSEGEQRPCGPGGGGGEPPTLLGCAFTLHVLGDFLKGMEGYMWV